MLAAWKPMLGPSVSQYQGPIVAIPLDIPCQYIPVKVFHKDYFVLLFRFPRSTVYCSRRRKAVSREQNANGSPDFSLNYYPNPGSNRSSDIFRDIVSQESLEWLLDPRRWAPRCSNPQLRRSHPRKTRQQHRKQCHSPHHRPSRLSHHCTGSCFDCFPPKIPRLVHRAHPEPQQTRRLSLAKPRINNQLPAYTMAWAMEMPQPHKQR